MEDSLHITVPYSPNWAEVRKVRKNIAEAMSEFPEEDRDAAALAASELVENALKYGEGIPEAPTIDLSLVCRGGTLTITVENGCRDPQAVRDLKQHTEALEAAPDKAGLYLDRVRCLLADPDVGGRLGIYRLGFEGGFDLRCSHHGNVVCMVATRPL